MLSCENAGYEVFDHFVEVNKMIEVAKGAKRKVQDYMLTRYGCYLIAQNGDSKKEEIAFAQTYFAVQTRKQEIIEDRLRTMNRLEARDRLKTSEKLLSKNIFERGVDEVGFARIRSKGDEAFVRNMKIRHTSKCRMKRKLKRYTKQLKDGKISLSEIQRSIAGWLGYVKHADSYNLRKSMFYIEE